MRVLVVNHNAGPWLARCLESLRVQTLSAFEAVVIDNASTDSSFPDRLPDARFRRVALDQNLGFAVANNLAARGATTPWLALLNPDAIAAPDWLEQLLGEALAHPECEIFGSTQLRADHPDELDGTGDCLSAWGISWRSGYGEPVAAVIPEGEVFAACGAAMMISTRLFNQLGGFEPRFFCYVEDVDLCFRGRLRGAGVWQSSRARVQHKGGASSGDGPSSFAMYHGHRNLLWAHMRCMPGPWLPLSLLGLTALMLLRAVTLRKAHHRHALMRALRDGYAGWRAAFAERVAMGRHRRVSAWDVASWLSWNPLDALRRPRVQIRPRKKNARP